MPLGRHVIVEQALRDVQQTLTGNTELLSAVSSAWKWLGAGL